MSKENITLKVKLIYKKKRSCLFWKLEDTTIICGSKSIQLDLSIHFWYILYTVLALFET